MVPFLPALIQMAKWLMPGLKLEQSGPFLELAAAYGQKAEHALPSEILSIGLKMFGRGLYTQLAYQTRTDWKWPYWLYRQADPADPAFQSVAHLIINQNRVFRNWTLTGLPGHTERLVIDPVLMVTPLREGFSLEFWIQEGDRLQPLFTDPGTPADYIPNRFPLIRRQTVTEKGFGIRQNLFVSTVGGVDFGFSRLKIRNTTNRMQTIRIWVSIRPYNPEGIAPVHQVRYDGTRNLWFVNGMPALVSSIPPSVTLCGSDSAGDVWNMPLKRRPIPEASCPLGLATAASVFAVSIPSNDIENLDFAFPLVNSESLNALDWDDREAFSYTRAKNRFYYRWNKEWEGRLSIQLPDAELDTLTTMLISYQSLFVQGNQLIPGYLLYQDFWFRDAAFLGSVLLKSGQFAPVRNLLLRVPDRQKSDGFFESQEGEWDSNGQVLWLAGQYWRLTQDVDTIRTIWEPLLAGARWIQRKRSQNSGDGEVKGMLPPGFSAEHFGANDFYYWDNFWSLAGYRELLHMAGGLGLTSSVTWLESELTDYTDTIMRSVQLVARDGNGALPPSPKRQMDAGSIGTVAAWYPLQLLPVDDPVMQATTRFLRDRFVTNGLFYHPVAHTGNNVYLSLHLLREKLHEQNGSIWNDLDEIRRWASPTGTWPEAMHPQIRGGTMGEGHHGWANAEWVSLVTDCLVYQYRDEVWLTPCLKPEWFDEPGTLALSGLQLPVGAMSLKMEWTNHTLRVSWDLKIRTQPAMLLWFLPASVIERLAEPGRFQNGKLILGENQGQFNFRFRS